MSLIRMALLGAIGYWVWKAWTTVPGEHTRRGEPSPSSHAPQEQSEPTSATPLSGPGEGMRVTSADSGGGSTRHTVGRGVV